MQDTITVDGNEAVARIAYQVSEVIALYPITPSSPMGELCDALAASSRPNLFGTVPRVIEMQSEGGAAGACHGALQAGALTTTFTASQGLLLMIPDMYKIAGELTCAVFHVAARSIATHALSIFGDHSDVMAARSTGWALLCSSSVQEAQDFALIAQMATLSSRLPVLHFFDGFRTSHEVARINALQSEDIEALIDRDLVREHKRRALDPDRPVLRGSAQNPDVFFQAREAINPTYDAGPAKVREAMQRFAERTGRRYDLFEYVGHEEAEAVIVLMGSGCGAALEVCRDAARKGERIGVLQVRLYRPFDTQGFSESLPTSVTSIAVLDRTKEPGAVGEPLYQDVVCALQETRNGAPMPQVIGGRYGLSSKEFTPAMVRAIFRELRSETPRKHFTVGIIDDVTHLSLEVETSGGGEPESVKRAVFYGLGSDGTVGANKNSVKIIGENTDLYAQGYFVYDSKKSGSRTVSHLRFSEKPITSTYLVQSANFVACHQFQFLEEMDILGVATEGATLLVNAPFAADELWDRLTRDVQETILEKKLELYTIDAARVAMEKDLGGRINTVMQTCFFALSGLLERDEAIRQIKASIAKSYGKAGEAVLARNYDAVDAALLALHEVPLGRSATSNRRSQPTVKETAPDFVQRVTARMLEGNGDLLPVSALPVDGTFPTGTACFEKRGIAARIPIWDPDVCIDCALCALVCPHAAIRMKPYAETALEHAPSGFKSKPVRNGEKMTIQVAPDDCTGCGICVDVCPARSKEIAKHKAIDMEPRSEHLERERAWFEYFQSLPEAERTSLDLSTVQGSQAAQPLFEFSGACAGCGETPYLKLLTQLFGDRMVVANATGCSSIYGGNLPTTPWTKDKAGRGPAWSNSLFEDNAEFGLGMRLAIDAREDLARTLLARHRAAIGPDLVAQLLTKLDGGEESLNRRRNDLHELSQRTSALPEEDARDLLAVSSTLVPRSVWIIGGDGWAYDIGFGGLDHVLASGANVNILVLDTEVYSNTGGQASKATPRAAVAKFAASGKSSGKKDLGMIAQAYGNVYVAQIAMGAHPKQTVRALREAEAHEGPSLVIAYSTCIAHGIDMEKSMSHQKEAVQTGYWPLFRYDPGRDANAIPFTLDSRAPRKPFRTFAEKEARFAMLERTRPEEAKALFARAQKDIDDRWHLYEQIAQVERHQTESHEDTP